MSGRGTDHLESDTDLHCYACDGDGKMGDQVCPICEGSGQPAPVQQKQHSKTPALSVLDEGEDSGVLGGRASTTVRGGTEQVAKNPPLDGTTFFGDDLLEDTPGQHASADAPAELQKLCKELAEAKQRIAELESRLGGKPESPDTPGEGRPRLRAQRPKTNVFLRLLDKSRLLRTKQLQHAFAIADDQKALAERLIEAGLLTQWQAGQLIAGRSSFFLDKYKLIQLLGREEIGSTFLAEHVTMHRRVLIKVISSKLSQEPASLERLLSEARTLAELEHPNIVQAYSVDQIGKRWYLVMEHVDGHNLDEIVRTKGPLDCHTAADYLRQAAGGLQHGHANSIIHGDIKPSSFLVDKHGVLKIADMGLSCLKGNRHPGTGGKNDSRMLDSIDYLAPEYAMGSMDIDHRADIYSLGCTLYFLLTGQPPFPEGLLHERLMKHQSTTPKDLRTFRSDIPDKLAGICAKMMAKNPEDRYASAAATAKEFLSFLATGK